MTNTAKPSELLPRGYQADNSLRHGHARHDGGSKASPTYQSWQAMRARCKYDGRDGTSRYKDRGITVCGRWAAFEAFLADMGERPDGTSLDRIDSNGNYEPRNCRWATAREQARNTRRNVLTLATATQVAVERLGGKSCREIAARYGISESLPREIVRGRTWPDALAAAKKIVESQND